MKNQLKLFLLALSTITFSCSDDAPEKTGNVLEVNSTRFPLVQTYVSSYTNTAGQTTYGLYFAGEGVKLTAYPTYDDIDGTGKLFYMELITTSADGLAAGTYPASSVSYSEYVGLIDGSWDTLDESIVTGNISVTKSGSAYTIDFTAEGNQGKYTLNYQGILQTARLGR